MTFTKVQYIALIESVNHWKDNIKKYDKGEGFPCGRSYCPCCIKFGQDCAGCPIRQYTGMTDCDGTPYDQVSSGRLHPRVMYKWLLKLLLGKEPAEF
jgi:hypothetical protein